MAEPNLKGRAQVVWLQRLEQEHDNLRAALRWYLAGDAAASAAGLQMAASLGLFWTMAGYLAEGMRWLTEAMARAGDASSAVRAKAHFALGSLIQAQGDLRAAPPAAARRICTKWYKVAIFVKEITWPLLEARPYG